MALHRIHVATDTNFEFVRPNFDLAAFDGDGRFAVSQGKRIKLSFIIGKGHGKHLLESPLSEDQTVKELGDGFAIEATVVQTLLLDRWLNSFGDRIWDIRKKEGEEV